QALAEDVEVWVGEAADIRQHNRKVARADAKPGRERCGKFVDGRRRNPPALAGIVRAVNCQGWKSAEESAALDRAAEHELMAPPPVVRARAVGWEGAAEIGGSECRHLLRHTQFDAGVV